MNRNSILLSLVAVLLTGFSAVEKISAQSELFSYSKFDLYEAHGAQANIVAFDKQGKLLASGGRDGTIILRNVDQKQQVQRLAGHSKTITALAFSPDGRFLASTSTDKTARIWNLQTGTSVVLGGHGKEVLAVAFSPSGNFVATAGADRQIILWSVETGTEAGVFAGHEKEVKYVFFLKDEAFISVGADRKIIEWDTKAKRQLRSWQDSGREISAAAVAPNGEWLFLAVTDRVMQKGGGVVLEGNTKPGQLLSQTEIKVYGLSSGSLQKSFDAGNKEVPALSVSADNAFLTAVSRGLTKSSIVVWDIKRGEQVAVIEQPSKDDMLSLSFSADGKWLASGNEKGRVDVWKTDGISPAPASTQTALRGQKNVFLTSREPLFFFSQPTTLAILDLAANGLDPSLAKVVSEQVRGAVAGGPNIRLIERQQIENVLQELKLQQTGATDAATAARIGRLLNIRKISYGSLSRLGKTVVISLQMVDVETAAIDGIRQLTCSNCADEDLLETVAQLRPALVPEKGQTATADSQITKDNAVNPPVSDARSLPQINLTSPIAGDSTDQEEITLRGVINDPAGLTKIKIEVSDNSRQLVRENKNPPEEITLAAPQRSFTIERRIKLNPGGNVITITAENKAGFQEQTSRLVYFDDQKVRGNRRGKAVARKWAFIVGISKYQDPNIRSLEYAHRDAEALYSFLQTPAGGSYRKENMVFLTNQEATWEEIRVNLREFLNKPEPDDLVLVYFAAHASPDPLQPSNVYLIANNTKIDKLAGTALSVKEIELALRENLRADRIVMFADTCFSANFSGIATRNVVPSAEAINLAFNDAIQRSKPGTFVVTSALGNEVSQEGRQWGGGHGVFTWYLLEALRGKADQDKDGRVTTEETFNFIYENVKRDTNGRQHPTNLSTKYDPDFPLAIYSLAPAKPEK